MGYRRLLVAFAVTIFCTAGTSQGLAIEVTSDANDVQLGALIDEALQVDDWKETNNSNDTNEELMDWKEIGQEYNATKFENWRAGRQLLETLTYMLRTSKQTDCTFVVGKDGQTEKIVAHTVILAAASPVFEEAFKFATAFRVADYQPSDFKFLLRLIYSGELCFEEIEKACTMLKMASSFGLVDAYEAAREYLANHMFPDRLWQAHQCAKETNDKKLLETVMKVISSHTLMAMRDPSFTEVSRDDIVTLLQRDDLLVDSEVELFEEVTRWGLQQVTKANQKPTPELIRQMLGPSIIKSIRFLTMNNTEFSRIYLNSKMLDNEEGLAVLLNINDPGGLVLPSTLSSSTEKRNASIADTFYSNPPGLGKCKGVIIDSRVNNDTRTRIPNIYGNTIHGIQIPKSLEARANCSLKERFDVIIVDSSQNIVQNYSYNQVPPCTTRRFKLTPSYAFDDNYLINVPFNPRLRVPREGIRYEIQIVFYERREYPKWVDAGVSESSSDSYSYSGYSEKTSAFGTDGWFYFFNNKPFVYSYFS